MVGLRWGTEAVVLRGWGGSGIGGWLGGWVGGVGVGVGGGDARLLRRVELLWGWFLLGREGRGWFGLVGGMV